MLEQLYQHEVDHLHILQERYHTHLDDEVLNLRPAQDELLAEELFQDIDPDDAAGGPVALYDKALEMERRTRDHFRSLARTLPEGPEQDVCMELAAEEDEHIALLDDAEVGAEMGRQFARAERSGVGLAAAGVDRGRELFEQGRAGRIERR